MKNSRKILIVEDEKVIQALCKRILIKMKYELVFAGGAQEASARIQESDDLDLLVTDMMLPDGDGIGVILRFREKYPRTKVLIITGSPTPESTLEPLKEMGFSKEDVLCKPFEIKEFESAVRKCLEER